MNVYSEADWKPKKRSYKCTECKKVHDFTSKDFIAHIAYQEETKNA